MEKLYRETYGVTRRSMNKAFIDRLPRSTKILEIGANLGQQLELLRQMGFRNVVGIEINEYAIRRAHGLFPGVQIMKASAFNLPFKDCYFDLVFTSGVLIHIAPKDVGRAIVEIHRTAKSLIWGFEYFDPVYAVIPYRGNKNVMWRGDFAGMYLKRFKDLRLLKQELYPYVQDRTKQDAMFLLKKK